MNLPNIIIKGNRQSLIEIEIIIAMLGYNSDEMWNKRVVDEFLKITNIKCYNNLNDYNYRSLIFKDKETKIFKVTEIQKIINYIESFKTKNNEKINE